MAGTDSASHSLLIPLAGTPQIDLASDPLPQHSSDLQHGLRVL